MSLEIFTLAVAAGILATYGLLTTALWAPRYGLPRIDFSRGMADLYWADSFDGKGPYWAAYAAIYVNGVIFALVYATEIGALLPGPGVLRGIIWGMALFLGAEFVFVPIFLKGGFFSMKVHPMAWATSLIVHGVWGAIVGWLCPVIQ